MLTHDEMELLITPALGVISRTHRITAAHLARQLEITRRQATALISEMAKRGLLARGESDGRYDVCINSAC